MFYEIREGSNRYKYIADDKTFLGTERSFCPACGREVGMAEYSAETPVFTLEGGKKYPDFLRHFSRGAVFSRRAVEVFLEAGVTGIEYSPVTVEKGTRILRKDNRILLI
jgi:ribosomal protein S27AE